jgi:hypothetical protein
MKRVYWIAGVAAACLSFSDSDAGPDESTVGTGTLKVAKSDLSECRGQKT